MQVILVEGILTLHFRSVLNRAHMKIFVDRCAPNSVYNKTASLLYSLAYLFGAFLGFLGACGIVIWVAQLLPPFKF